MPSLPDAPSLLRRAVRRGGAHGGGCRGDGGGGRGGHGRTDGGFLTVQYLVAVACSLVLFTLLANLVVVQYARGVVRTAIDDGVRVAARLSSADAAVRCETVAGQALADLLGGAMGRGVSVDCDATVAEVTATAVAEFRGWLPGVPTFATTERAVAVRERLP